MALFQNLVIAVYFHYIFIFNEKKTEIIVFSPSEFSDSPKWIGVGCLCVWNHG